MDLTGLVAAFRSRLDGALIALDFDGTLAPIVADPAASRPVAGAIEILTALANASAQIAVITGRDARTVIELGGLAVIPRIKILGLYGVESWSEGQLTTVETPPAITALRSRLPAVVSRHGTDDGVWIEDKRLSLVVHARQAADPAAQLDLVRGPVGVLAAELGMEIHDGRDVLEVRLPGFDKGSALRRLVTEVRASAVLFAGDDVGDLPAFEAVRDLRSGGLSAWSVAAASAEAPEVQAAADVHVAGPAAVVDLLARIAGREPVSP